MHFKCARVHCLFVTISTASNPVAGCNTGSSLSPAPYRMPPLFSQTHRPPWMKESCKKGKKKSKKEKISMWEHEFICLVSCGQTVPPSPMDKAELIRAGLGPKKLSLFEYGEPWEFHDEIVFVWLWLCSTWLRPTCLASMSSCLDLSNKCRA